MKKKIAFYAPIKPPNHPIASGDRLIANNLISALKLAGFNVEVASEFIAYSKHSATEILQQRRQQALSEAKKIVKEMQKNRPDIWCTYHPYCKAPDWLGAYVTSELKIPYVNIEACKTGLDETEWQLWRTEAQRAMALADMHICLKPNDKNYLQKFLRAKFCDLAPFISVNDKLPKKHIKKNNVIQLITVAQMRPGKKQKNYKILADVLRQIKNKNWQLTIVGVGPQANEIKNLFNEFKNKIIWRGGLQHKQVLAAMGRADIFIWPGLDEPIGMVYLEAQLSGLATIALKSGGVPLVVYENETGLLASDKTELVILLEKLLANENLRKKLGAAARQKIISNHSLEVAAKILRKNLDIILFND